MPVEDTVEAPMLARLTASERERVLASAHQVAYADGERLFDPGQPAEGCWIVHSGQIALDVPIPGRGDVVVQTVGPGDVVGWSWLLPPYRWHFGARAVGVTTTTKLDTGVLQVLAQEDPSFGYSLVLTLSQAMLQRLQATRARLLDLYRNPASNVEDRR